MHKILKLSTALLVILYFASCVDSSSQEKERIQKLESEVEELKKKNDSKNLQNVNPVAPRQNKPESEKLNFEKLNNKRYVFAKFDITYYAMSGLNQDSQYTDAGITNILEIENYTEGTKYKLKDLIKAERVLLKAPFAKDQKKLNIQILDFKDYVSASKEREKIDYKYEISLSPILSLK